MKGNFEFKGIAAEPEFVFLALPETSQRQKPLGVFVEGGKINVTASKDSLSKGKVTGSATQDEYQKYYSVYSGIDDRQRQLYQQYQQASMTGDVKTIEDIQKKV